MSDSDRELARLWRVSRTVHEMVRDRVSRNAHAGVEGALSAYESRMASRETIRLEQLADELGLRSGGL